MRIILALFTVALAISSAHAESHRLAKKWETEAQLRIPESVYFDAERKVLYVSNIDGEPWGDDGKGSIAKVGLDGKIIAVDWISGLNAPKGTAMRDSRLYVGDLTNVVVIDIDKGAIAERIAVTGSEGLNDVAIDSDGTVYVSDTKTKKVFAIKTASRRYTSTTSRARTDCCFTTARSTCSTARACIAWARIGA
jgi:DNA-binding beta-propeller fold protein YncE